LNEESLNEAFALASGYPFYSIKKFPCWARWITPVILST
jgi:hypothetical protein